jgi:hypothetical protein
MLSVTPPAFPAAGFPAGGHYHVGYMCARFHATQAHAILPFLLAAVLYHYPRIFSQACCLTRGKLNRRHRLPPHVACIAAANEAVVMVARFFATRGSTAQDSYWFRAKSLLLDPVPADIVHLGLFARPPLLLPALRKTTFSATPRAPRPKKYVAWRRGIAASLLRSGSSARITLRLLK